MMIMINNERFSLKGTAFLDIQSEIPNPNINAPKERPRTIEPWLIIGSILYKSESIWGVKISNIAIIRHTIAVKVKRFLIVIVMGD